MRGLGTIVDMLAIIVGGGFGLLIKGGLKKKMQDTLMQACGLATIFIGIEGTLSGMFTVTDGTIQTSGTLLLICSLVICYLQSLFQYFTKLLKILLDRMDKSDYYLNVKEINKLWLNKII